jgi:DNA-binding SARP family transcriptional activator/predicted Ser/Thr protein kinase
MSSLKLFLLGPPRLERDGVPLELDRRKNVALIAYLAVTGESHTREALVTLLWPELEPSRTRAGLRRNLSMLRKALGGEWLIVDREIVGTDPDADFWLDVDQFRHLLQAGQEHNHPEADVCPDCLTNMAQAVELYRGDFLEGFTLRDSPTFDEFQFFQTEGLRRELASALEQLVRGHSAQGAFESAIRYARRWLALDPLHEPVHRHLMQLYAWSGQRAAALRQYTECKRVLQEELGVESEEETTQLYQAIKEKRHPPTPRDHFAAHITSPTVAPHDRYRLGAELGRGGMGTVYRAHNTVLERDVAIKVLDRTNLGTEGRARLLREAQTVAQLNHPNIVTVYDVGEAALPGGSGPAVPFVVMEFVEGRTLHEQRPQKADDILAITRQICAALDHAHGRGIVHRDLRPENVIITPDPLTGTGPLAGTGGTVKLMDFGLARSMASRLTGEGAISGTVFYLAPELAMGHDFDGRADLYALGVMLYELTTGRLPFTADDPMAVITQHLHAPVVPPRAKNAEIPPALDTLIVRLLSKDPADRPASASEVLRILEQPSILDKEAVPAEELSVLERIERGRMVGRERELQEARGLWNQALSSQGRVLLISGEPGIGKTRLVRELVTQAEVSGGRALVGASYAEGGVPYAPFARVLRHALENTPFGDLGLPEYVLPDLLTLAPALRLSYPDVEPSPALDDPKTEQHRLSESLVLLITALSERVPLMLVLEDAHWADSSTLFLLRHLARRTRRRRVMIAATYREVELDQARPFHEMLLDLNREWLATRLKLPRLNREQTGEMLEILFDEEIEPKSLDVVYRETEGNPFFIEEICKALVESGKLWYEDGRWHGPSIEELGIPQSVRVAIQSRMQVLPVEAQETLRLAAILGREFDFDTLAEASDQNKDTLIDALESAERAQLIEELSGEGGGTFAFAHALFASTLVESTRTLQRRQLHRRVAVAVEARHPEDFEALAHHYTQAGEAKKAADYLLKAGDRARRLYANEEAIGHYRGALALLDEPPLSQARKDWRLEALKGLGQVYFGMGKLVEAEEHLRGAITLGREMELAVREMVRLYHWLAETSWWQGRFDDQILLGEEGLALLGDDVESVEAVLMIHAIAVAHWDKGNLAGFRELCYRTAQLIERLPYSPSLGPAYVHIVGAYMYDKNVEEALKWAQTLEERATAHRDLRALGEAHGHAGNLLAWTGNLHSSVSRYRQGLELLARIGDVAAESLWLGFTGAAFLSLGDLIKAEEYAGRMLEIARVVGYKQGRAVSCGLIGEIALCRGGWGEAVDAFQEAIQRFQEIGDRVGVTGATYLLGQAYLAQGDREQALRQFQEVLALTGPEELKGYLRWEPRGVRNRQVAGALSGLEEAYEDPEAFRAFCDRRRAQAGDGPFVQWYLEPTDVRAIRSDVPHPQSPLREEFVETLPSDWVWQDPFDDCSFTVRNGLEIRAANGRDLWFINLGAPRVLRPVGGDWPTQTVCGPASEEKPAIGGLLLWKDKENYLRLDRGVTGEHEILFTGCLGNRDMLIGRGRLKSDASGRVFFRLERGGDRVNAFCSADGENWFTVGHVEFPVEDPVQVGLHAIGNIDRSVYHGAYPDGTVIRFESFHLWAI